VRGAVIVNEGVVGKTNRVDHQRIAAFVMPDGLAIGADLGMRRMRNVEKDAAHFGSAFVNQQNLVLPLHEIKRVDAAHDDKSRDTAGTAARAGLECAFACCGKLVLLPHIRARAAARPSPACCSVSSIIKAGSNSRDLPLKAEVILAAARLRP